MYVKSLNSDSKRVHITVYLNVFELPIKRQYSAVRSNRSQIVDMSIKGGTGEEMYVYIAEIVVSTSLSHSCHACVFIFCFVAFAALCRALIFCMLFYSTIIV